MIKLAPSHIGKTSIQNIKVIVQLKTTHVVQPNSHNSFTTQRNYVLVTKRIKMESNLFRFLFNSEKENSEMAPTKDWKKVKSAVTINAALGNMRCYNNISNNNCIINISERVL